MKTEEIFANTVLIPPQNGTENCLAVGTRLVDFEITGILGEGGFGIVYVAFDHSLQRTVAIKEYMPGTLSGRAPDGSVMVRAERHREAFDAGLKSFINEARLLAQFDHPSLVKVYRFWELNKTAYMAMRYYDGQTLKDIVRERPEIVTEAWLKFIFKQILEALDTLYKAKVLHRDVSPDNIIVQKNGDAVLLDFGSARQIIGDMTQGLTVILKPGYAPVEQYSDDASMTQGPWTDIYALAAVMYFAIAKTPPVTSVARMIKDSLVMLQDGTHVGFSYKFLVAIDKGLALQPEDRPQTMDEFRRLLGIPAFASRTSRSSRASKPGAEGSHKTDHTGPKTQNRSRRIEPSPMDRDLPKPVLYGLAGVALVAALAGWFWLKGSSGNDVNNTNVPDTAASASAVASVPPASPAPVPVASAVSVPAALAGSSASASASASTSTGVSTTGAPAGAEKASSPASTAQLKAKASAGASAVASIPASAAASNAGSAAPAAVAANSASAAAEAAKTEEVPPAFMLNVKLTVKPWGEVRVDGKKIGVSPPLKRFQLPEGKHQIRISNQTYPDYVKDIDVVKSNRKRAEQIEVDFSAGQK